MALQARVQFAVRLGDEETYQRGGPCARGVDQVIVEIAHRAIGHGFHVGRAVAQPTQGRAAGGHVFEGEGGQVVHGGGLGWLALGGLMPKFRHVLVG